MGLRKKIRRALKPLFSKNAFIVAGLGRCGTTLMYNAITKTSNATKEKKFLARFGEQDRYVKGTIYKTHDLPPAHLPPHVKLVFMFGNPMNAALSGFHEFEDDRHYHHVGSDRFGHRENIFTEDILLLEKHFDSWYRPQNFEFIAIRYESLYEEQTLDMLEEYLGFRVALPPFRKRKTNWESHPMKDSLQKTYSRLDAKIRAAEACRIWNPVRVDSQASGYR